MDREDCVSFEVARLLKDKGFREECLAFYVNWGCHPCEFYSDFLGDDYNDPLRSSDPLLQNRKMLFSAPTLYQATKWLREEHGFHIQMVPVIGNKWSFDLADICLRQDMCGEYISRVPERECYPVYKTYETALNAGIEILLKLIKKTER